MPRTTLEIVISFSSVMRERSAWDTLRSPMMRVTFAPIRRLASSLVITVDIPLESNNNVRRVKLPPWIPEAAMDPFVAIPVSREGRSLVEWLDESISVLDAESNKCAKRVALGCADRACFLCIEQLRRTLMDIRANL